MSTTKVTCKTVMNHICENLGEDLNSEKCIAIKNHLDHCDNCKNYFNSVEQTIEFYKKYNINLPNEAHERLLNVLGLKKE
jgi:predicted anti-sigma-YlaC factor YlaD